MPKWTPATRTVSYRVNFEPGEVEPFERQYHQGLWRPTWVYIRYTKTDGEDEWECTTLRIGVEKLKKDGTPYASGFDPMYGSELTLWGERPMPEWLQSIIDAARPV